MGTGLEQTDGGEGEARVRDTVPPLPPPPAAAACQAHTNRQQPDAHVGLGDRHEKVALHQLHSVGAELVAPHLAHLVDHRRPAGRTAGHAVLWRVRCGRGGAAWRRHQARALPPALPTCQTQCHACRSACSAPPPARCRWSRPRRPAWRWRAAPSRTPAKGGMGPRGSRRRHCDREGWRGWAPQRTARPMPRWRSPATYLQDGGQLGLAVGRHGPVEAGAGLLILRLV